MTLSRFEVSRLKFKKSWRMHWSNRLDSVDTPLQVTSLSRFTLAPDQEAQSAFRRGIYIDADPEHRALGLVYTTFYYL